MKMKMSVSRMCVFLQERFYEKVEPTAHPELSSQRIRELAFAKLQQQSATGGATIQEKEKRMKKSIKILLVAAIMCAMSATAFAANGGMEFFKSIFGSSAESIGEHIQSPMASVEDDGYRLTAESLLSDGFKAHLIISLTPKSGKPATLDPIELFNAQFVDSEGVMNSASYSEMPEFAHDNTRYYHLELTSFEKHDSAKIKVSLKEDLAPLSVTVTIDDAMTARKEIQINAEDYENKNYYPETVQLSPMGVLVIGSEKEAKGGLPTAQIFVQMKDGTSEELISEMSFDNGDETVRGGGEMILVGDGEIAPLVTVTMGERNPDGKVVTTGTFSRILNLDEVQAIIVDNTEYPL
jgi:hypothetical protein